VNTAYRCLLLLVLPLALGCELRSQAENPPTPSVAAPTSTDQKYLFCFTQKNCPQCEVMKPTWEKLRATGKYKILVVDLDKDRLGMFKTFNVEQTPLTVYVVKKPSGSKEHWRFVGVKTEKEIQAQIAETPVQ